MKNTVAAVLVLSIFISGCTNKYQKAAQEIGDSLSESSSLSARANAECNARILANRSITPLYDKIINPISGAKTLGMLNNQDHVGEKEKLALDALDKEIALCEKNIADIFRSHPLVPSGIPLVISEFYASGKSDRADLWGGIITYGEYNRRRANAFSKMEADWSNVIKRAEYEFNIAAQQSQYQDSQNIQRLSQSLSNMRVGSPVQSVPSYVPAAPAYTPPQNTRCRQNGAGVVDCTTTNGY